MQPVPVPMSSRVKRGAAEVGLAALLRIVDSCASQCSVSGRGMRVGGRTRSESGRGWKGCFPAVTGAEVSSGSSDDTRDCCFTNDVCQRFIALDKLCDHLPQQLRVIPALGLFPCCLIQPSQLLLCEVVTVLDRVALSLIVVTDL